MKHFGAAGMNKSVLLAALTVGADWWDIVREVLRLFGLGR
jgi:hypothetical protein